MITILLIAEASAGIAGMLLLILVSLRAANDRHLRALAGILILFLLSNAAFIYLTLFSGASSRGVILQVWGFLLLAILGACAWGGRPLLLAASSRRWMMAVVAIALIVFSIIHIRAGLFTIQEKNGSHILFALNSGGKYLLSFLIVGSVLLLGKFESLTQAVVWRLGKRGVIVALTLLFLVLSIAVLSSVSLVYGRISRVFLIGSLFLSAVFFVVLLFALWQTPIAQKQNVPSIRVKQYLSSGVLIYSGLYLIGMGLLVKAAILLGGDWRQFISFFAALGAIALALALITGKSLRDRWTRFVERTLLAGTYDFRRELQNLTETISTATDRDKILAAICRSLDDIFTSDYCCLLLKGDRNDLFQVFGLDTNNNSIMTSDSISPSPRQLSWLERTHSCFIADDLLALREESEAGDDLNRFLQTGDYELGSALFSGRQLLGVVLLGHKHHGELYSEEDKQLLEVLASAISISIHGINLQQRFLESKQMESIFRMASFIVHDLRNAVYTLTLLTQNAKAHLETKAFRADFTSALTRVCNEMQMLLQKLSSVKAGSDSPNYEKCNPVELIMGMLDDLPIPQTVKLNIDIDPLPIAFWDKNHIRIVLRNILTNSLEAMPEGGRLVIRGRHDHSHIHISVHDTGVGMSEEFIRQHLFKPNQTTKSKGLGIGLYQSKEIVTAHQGKILVESQPGSGTTFEIVLPFRLDERMIPDATFAPEWEKSRSTELPDTRLRELVTV